jgi:type II secretion system protein D
MKPSLKHLKKFGPATGLLCACLASALLIFGLPGLLMAQDVPKVVQKKKAAEDSTTPAERAPANPAIPVINVIPPTGDSGKAGAATLPSDASPSSGTNNVAKTDAEKALSNEEIQVSFQGANVDMIIQWLAQTTGKSVVKHPRVQCQLTIVSSKKVTPREAITLVYRALALEGFTAIESSKSILIVPEGSEPKMSPELIDASRNDVPVGRQRLVKVFPLKFIQAGDLKERVKGVLTEKGTIDVDERANQLIITDYTDNIGLAGDLITILDTDKPGDMAVRVISLKHVSAQDLVKEVAPLYTKVAGKSPKEMIEVSANDRSNTLIIFSSESNFKAVDKLVATLDTEDGQEKSLMAFPLKNADAQDVAKQLQELMSDQDNNSRMPYYYFSGQSQSKNTKKMSVVADRRRNTLIVQAPPSQLGNIGKMIAALDEPVSDDSLAPKIYPLKYVSAVDIEDVLNELFLKKQNQRSYWSPFGDGMDSSTTDRDVGRLYGKVRITSEPYSNAIILTSNSPENLAAVEAILKQLDVPSEAGETTLRVGLRFAKAATVANSINVLFAKNGSPPLRPVVQNGQQYQQQYPQQQQQNNTIQSSFELEQESKEDGYFPWLGGQQDNPRNGDGRNSTRPVSDLVGRVRVVPDQRSNSLLISANVHFFPQVLKLIEDLDAPTAQVLIEAKIVEVSSDFLDKLGVRWSPNGAAVFTPEDLDNSVLAHVKGDYAKQFGGVSSALANSLHSGIIDSTISLDFLVQFLRRTTDATVLAEPQINIADNELGKLFVGQQVPFIDKSLSTDLGGLNQSFSYKDVGIILEVTPHINNSGDVALRIRAESSSIVPGQTLFGGAILDTRNFKTDLTAKNGQTIVLGGIIQRQVSDTLRKTPFLGDIPGLGWLFKKKDKSAHEVELMVFLRPKVVRTPQEAQELLDEVDKKAPLIKEWKYDIRPKNQKEDKTGAKKPGE